MLPCSYFILFDFLVETISKRPRRADEEEADTTGDTCSPPGSIKDSPSGKKESYNEEQTNVVKEDSESTESASAAAVRTALLMEEDLQLDAGFTTFPEKLMKLLDSEEVKDRMWWLPDGDGFAFKPDNFAETVLSRHFGGTRLESFTRKLNRCVSGMSDIFYVSCNLLLIHPLFFTFNSTVGASKGSPVKW